MRLISRKIWSILFIALSLPTLYAEKKVTFCLPVVNNAKPGEVVNLPVRVANFDSIVGVQFVLQWDPNVINYLSVLNFNLPSLTINNFNTNETSQGILRFSWNTTNVKTGVSLPDSTSIFIVKFGVKGQNGQGTPVVFTEIPPTDFEVTKAGNPVTPPPLRMKDCFLKHGYVAVGFSVNTVARPNGAELLSLRVCPNPFLESTVVAFELSSVAEIYLLLIDAAGREVKSWHSVLPEGQHGIEIASSQLPRSGVYFLVLHTKTQVSIQPLVRL
ncbi:MAG: cohesin domain-containing protein [Saprospiraceae bacterium]|nr:cohesin domain-containing protein [Saprospiraceae bacterium]MDW8484233.1 cohesin domain-containing protein [Saprospiraceae bacterium]